LPPDVPHFTGRAAELAALTALLDQSAERAPDTIVISAIGGMAGVGKTALVVHWAHRVADRFPDGQLYVNLRGYDPGRPVSAGDALARFLRALGMPGQEIPAEEDERAARYRSLLAGRRMLVVLDNAGSVEQTRPLLPGSPSCTVLVTSRDALAGLVARDGATRLDLEVLSPEEAVSLLRVLIGGRADTEPDAVVALAARCCQLPLALRVAAEVAASRPVTPLALLAAELYDQRKRLDLLAADADPRTAVRSVFSWSYRHLDAATARAFRLLGLHPGTDFGPYALAALTGGHADGVTAEQAGQTLGLLARAHLIQPARSGRYSMHDLLRVYASEIAAEDSEAKRRAALTSLFDHYLHTAAVAMDTLYPAEHDRRPRLPPASAATPPVTDLTVARQWLDAERGCLIAAAAYAADHGWPEQATALAATLFRYLEVACHFPELTSLCDCALRAARGAGDRPGEARALHDAVVVDLIQGRYEQAATGMRQALVLYRELGDRMREASTLDHLGIASYLQGRCTQAARYHEQAIVLYQKGNDWPGQARALNNLGLVELRQGQYDRATARFLEVLNQSAGDQANEVNSLANLGIIDLRQGRYQQAAEHLHRALALSRQTGNPIGECYSLTNLALVDLRLGRHQEAFDRLQQALTLCRKHGAKSEEAEALNCLGDVLLATGQPAEAQLQYATALTMARQIHDKQELARAHSGLGHALHATSDPGQARHYWQQALSLYEQIGAPEATQLRAELAALNPPGLRDGRGALTAASARWPGCPAHSSRTTQSG
jgi:tetratricopeptide (TPR) repeat protein